MSKRRWNSDRFFFLHIFFQNHQNADINNFFFLNYTIKYNNIREESYIVCDENSQINVAISLPSSSSSSPHLVPHQPTKHRNVNV